MSPITKSLIEDHEHTPESVYAMIRAGGDVYYGSHLILARPGPVSR